MNSFPRVALNVVQRLFTTDYVISELEAYEALTWLRAAGFPQYSQMFEDGQFPLELSFVEKDHDFLDTDSLHSLFRGNSSRLELKHNSNSGNSSRLELKQNSNSGNSSSIELKHNPYSGNSSSLELKHNSNSGNSSSLELKHNPNSGNYSSLELKHNSNSGNSSSLNQNITLTAVTPPVKN
ncbi:hypothetical protein RRG08_020104 [Elysia crispata]|uniref:Uncharacterized protein n=1 Tax=Elysia crispata TaxID=231223 RepID=A0AAE1A4J9_9GAST|nr:hypothetical protein RRG08_020104 [Elysia crispata]